MKSRVNWTGLGLFLAFAAGIALRLTYLQDMEFKEDEHYDFIQAIRIGREIGWPALGMPTGVYIPNPGLSVWVFAILARLIGAHDPVSLQHGVGMVAVLGIALVGLAARRESSPQEREPWLWAMALALVNPIAVYLERKLWPQAFLVPGCMLYFLSWQKRETRWGAFGLGALSLLLGQIHLSGFFLAASVLALTLLQKEKKKLAWRPFLLGAGLGLLPLLPWLAHMAAHLGKPGWGGPPNQPWTALGNLPTPFERLEEIFRFRYWGFFFSNPFGLHLGNPLGIHRGASHWVQLQEFNRYPLILGHPSFAVLIAHFLLGMGLLYSLARSLVSFRFKAGFKARFRSTPAYEQATLWGAGLLMTLTGTVIRRFYTVIAFPFTYLWAARSLLSGDPRVGRRLLLLVCVLEAVVSASFIQFVHLNRGALEGDYGDAFHVTVEKNLRATGKPWADRPIDYWQTEKQSDK